MKKKLILMLSIMAIAVCMFSLTVSATNAVYLSGDYLSGSLFDLSEGNSDYNFRFLGENTASDDFILVLYNVEEFLSFAGTKTAQEIKDYFSSLYNELGSSIYNNYSNISLEAYEYFLNYSVVSEDDLTQQYNNGFSEGIEYFKTSTEYETTLNNKYVLGQKEGVANYLKSDDYTNALDAEYDAGYNQGVSDTESTSSSSGTGALFSVLAIVLVVLAGFYIYKSVSRKRRR